VRIESNLGLSESILFGCTESETEMAAAEACAGMEPPEPPRGTTTLGNGTPSEPIPSGEKREMLKDLAIRLHAMPRTLPLTMRESFLLRENIMAYFKDASADIYDDLTKEFYGDATVF